MTPKTAPLPWQRRRRSEGGSAAAFARLEAVLALDWEKLVFQPIHRQPYLAALTPSCVEAAFCAGPSW